MAIHTELRDRDFAGVEVDEHLQYRALSIGAVISVLLGLLSFMTIPTAMRGIDSCLLVCPLPLAGLVVGLRSMWRIHTQPEDLTGMRVAATCSFLSAGFLVGGLSLAIFIYATEVPDGYERITFVQLKPDPDAGSRVIVPPEIMEKNGKKVFIKGYMRPPAQRTAINNFLLVRDNNECCYGDLDKVAYYDQMVVQLAPDMRTNYSTGVFRVGGILHIEPRNARPGSDEPVFRLSADHLK